jgi:protein-disulfide isomerase
MEEHEHYFTGHTNARLTFVIGIISGVSIATGLGLAFFAYIFSGGELGSYGIAPLDTDSQILTEPIKEIVDGTAGVPVIAVPADTQMYGATENYSVTLVQYVDYECRFCKKFFPDILEFVDQHPDVRFIVKHYPLVQIHPSAKTAAVAASCAGQQGKFFDYSLALLSNQASLADVSLYDRLAIDSGLDSVAFSTCRADAAVAGAIEADVTEALSISVESQPNLVLWHNDGTLELIDGYVNMSYVASALADELVPTEQSSQ